MKQRITLFNFSNIYKAQNFYKDSDYYWVECSDLLGTNGYCDESASMGIQQRLKQTKPTKINFIDSGNYHYVAYFLLERLKQPFCLVLFDHHTDLQPSLFETLLSCGCWLKKALDDLNELKEVIIIGAKQELIEAIEPQYRCKITAYSESQINHAKVWEQFALKHIHYPVYISLDKDVMATTEAKTNWDQGSMPLHQLREIYGLIEKNYEILGIDICGECSVQDYLACTTDNKLNNEFNKKILNFLETTP